MLTATTTVAAAAPAAARVVLQFLGAELDRDFASVGGFAPFAVLRRVSTEGEEKVLDAVEEVVRTRAHKGGHRRPVWNEVCEGPLVEEAGCAWSAGSYELSIFSESLGAWAKRRPTFCGAAVVSLHDLLGGDFGVNPSAAPWDGLSSHEFVLQKRGERTGVVFLRAQLLRCSEPPGVNGRADDENQSRSDEMTAPQPGPGFTRLVRPASAGMLSGEDGSGTAHGIRNRLLHLGRQRSCPGPGGADGAAGAGGLAAVHAARVDPELFESPVEPFGVSGGTAAFYRLRLRKPPAGRSAEHYIGKDLSHASDEVLFYEEARILKRAGGQGFGPLLSFMLDYRGVVACPVQGAEKVAQLLVLRNLCDGSKRLRMLDIKIGERTADAGWQGKSRLRALKHDVLDGLTTSVVEGYRVEGFDAPPPAFSSMDPLLDVSRFWKVHRNHVRKKARRFMLQRMPSSEIMTHFLDVHQEPPDPGHAQLPFIWSPMEVAEVALHEMCCRLSALSLACRRAPAPQKWVGSSVALGFDAGGLPPRRGDTEAQVRRRVRVNIFDWGRSEMNTLDRHESLPEDERHDRGAFWRYYVGGVDRLAWTVARCYRHRFGCTEEDGWSSLQVAVYDFDSLTSNDFIGQATLPPLSETPEGEERTVMLQDQAGRPCRSFRGPPATLTYRVRYRAYPDNSRLAGAWCVTVVRAEHLPACDKLTQMSDPFAILSATSRSGRFRFGQQTSVQEKELSPSWEETFELPLARSGSCLAQGLDASAPGLGVDDLQASLLPPADTAVPTEEADRALAVWSQHIDRANQLMLQARADLSRSKLEALLSEGSGSQAETPPRLAAAPRGDDLTAAALAARPRVVTS